MDQELIQLMERMKTSIKVLPKEQELSHFNCEVCKDKGFFI